MRILVVGASGSTGVLLVKQLLSRGQSVNAIVRSPDKLPEEIKNHSEFTMIQASVFDLSASELGQYVKGCGAVASCLGHNMTMKGIYSQPRRLVTDVTRRLCNIIKANKPEASVKFVLMNTAGNSNRDLNERVSFAHGCVISLLRLLLPPHVDNEMAADYLRTHVGQNNSEIEWAVVRPDTLTNDHEVSRYKLHHSPTRSAIFNAGLTSRINVAHFMSELINDSGTWIKWKGKMPIIYNRSSS